MSVMAACTIISNGIWNGIIHLLDLDALRCRSAKGVVTCLTGTADFFRYTVY